MPIAPDIPAAEAAIIEMTNTFRKAHKLSTLTTNAKLAAAARAYAKVLGQRGQTLSHSADATTPTSRAKAAGYGHCRIAENLAAIYDSRGLTGSAYAKRAMQGWENSPGHRQNLLMPNVTETGVAVVRAGPNDPRYIVVQLFAQPLTFKYSVTIANRSRAPVSYAFNEDSFSIAPRQHIIHTGCMPGTITFSFGPGPARYDARDGQVYTLSAGAGGVNVKVTGGGVTP